MLEGRQRTRLLLLVLDRGEATVVHLVLRLGLQKQSARAGPSNIRREGEHSLVILEGREGYSLVISTLVCRNETRVQKVRWCNSTHTNTHHMLSARY